MLAGIVELLYWEAQPFRLDKPSPGHVALLITPSEPQDFSDIQFPQMRDRLPLPGQLYVSFYTEGMYRAYLHDVDPSAGYFGYPPDRRISLPHLDIGAVLDRLRMLLSIRPRYSRFASTAQFFMYNNRREAVTECNCVSFALELLFAGGIGQHISAWRTLGRINTHVKSWLSEEHMGGLWTPGSITLLIAFAFKPSFVWNAYVRMLKEMRVLAYYMKDTLLTDAPPAPVPPIPPNVAIMLALLAIGVVTPMTLDAFKKWKITSPADVYELVETIAQELPQQSSLNMMPSSSPSSSGVSGTSHEMIPSSTASTSRDHQSSIPSRSPFVPTSAFGSTSGSTYFSPGKPAVLNAIDEDNMPLQSSFRYLPCGFL